MLNFDCYRKVKRDSISAESHADKTQVCKQEDDHVFVKPAEPKSRDSIDCEQNKEKLVSVLFFVKCCFNSYCID